jgi:hypothetical protein
VKIALILVFLSISSAALAENGEQELWLPSAPSAIPALASFISSGSAPAETAQSGSPAVFPTMAVTAPHLAPNFEKASASGTKPRVLDRKFFLFAGMAATATILDISTTSQCISKYADCTEGNPLFGLHPSPAKLYGINLSILAGQVFASAWMKRQMPDRKLWMIPAIAATATHAFAAAMNVRTMHQLNAAAEQ